MNISDKAKKHADSCRFCWMCRHVCPIGNADGQERNNARARALMVQYVVRGTLKLEDCADSIYECSLCGACTNNCKTGWDPKIFIQETKTQIVLRRQFGLLIRGLFLWNCPCIIVVLSYQRHCHSSYIFEEDH